MIYGFNKACSNIAASHLKVGNESMSAIQFFTTSKENLPHLFYIFHKPELLGVEFKTSALSVTGSFIFLDSQWGKEGINSSRYCVELGATSACTKILMEETKGMGQRALKVSTTDCLLFVSWLLSKKSEEAAASIFIDLIGVMKISTKGFCKATIEGFADNWSDGYYIVMRSKTMFPGEIPLLAIGYK